MTWTLDILNPDGSPRATRSNAAPGGVWDGFVWKWSRYGDCLTLNFDAVMPDLGVRNRDILALAIDGVPVFKGPVVEAPHPRDPRRGTVNAVGCSALLYRRVIGQDTYQNVDVAVIVRDLIQKYRHPAITFNAARIPDTGKILTSFRMPWRPLGKALELLAKTVAGENGVPFGVLPSGEFFFGADQTPSVPIPYSAVSGLKYLRVSGDEVITSNYMVFLTRPAGTPYSRVEQYRKITTRDSGGAVTDVREEPQYTYVPATYIYRADDPDAALYGLETATLVPGGADIFSPVPNASLTANGTNLTNPGNVLDGDTATFAAHADGAYFSEFVLQQAAGLAAPQITGFRARYRLQGGTGIPGLRVTMWITYDFQVVEPQPGGGSVTREYRTRFYWDLPDTSEGPIEVVGVMPLPADDLGIVHPGSFTPTDPTFLKTEIYVTVRQSESVNTPIPADTFRLYDIQPLGLDFEKLDTIARKALSPPVQEPTEFTLPYLLGVTPTITLTGLPGGDQTGDVVELEGRHDGKALRSTTVKLEQPGASESARIIRLVAKERAVDAQDDLRAFLEGPV